jgi:glyoxylase-like metal-dependent hydrolase (beta-lactamase superfamily II)
MNTPAFPYKIFELPIPISGHEGRSHLFLIQSAKTALIDTGPASTLPLLFARLEELDIDPLSIDYVLGTHIHLDHLGGLNQALIRMPRAKAVVHPRGLPHLEQPAKLWQASLEMSGAIALEYGRPQPVATDKLLAAGEGQVIELGGIRLEIIFTPGHAGHHLSFIDRQNGNLFAGEAAGVYFPDNGVNRPASPIPFDMAQTLASLDKLIATQPRIVYYCHYGSVNPGLANLQNFRRQLLLWNDTVSKYFVPGKELDDALVETIVDALISQDGTKAQICQFSPQRLKPELYFLRNNVRGFWDYFLRKNLKPT